MSLPRGWLRIIHYDKYGNPKVGDADKVDGIHAASTATANKLLAMNAAAKFPAHTVDGDLRVEGVLYPNLLRLGAATTRTLSAAGVLDGSGVSLSAVVQNTRAQWTSEDLNSITGGVGGQVLVLYPRYYAEHITAKDGTLKLAGDFTSMYNAAGSGFDTLTLMYDSANSYWVELCRSDNTA